MTASWTLPVLPFHERPKYSDGYVTIEPKMLLEFCTPIEMEGIAKLQFDSSYKICSNVIGRVGI